MYRRDLILFVAPFSSSFIESDISILSSHYELKLNIFNWRKKILVPFLLVGQFILMLFWIRKIKRIVIEFGGYWSLIPSFFGWLFKVPVFIVLHGTDCASLPHIRYGSLRKFAVRTFCGASYQLANKLLPVSSSLIYVENNYDTCDTYQGVSYFFPHIKTTSKVIFNGLDVEFWTPSGLIKKEEKTFIAVFGEKQFDLKGGDLIVLLAKQFKDCTFYIVGSLKPKTLNKVPDNMVFLGKLSKFELREQYRKAQFHFQLSVFEGFGLALCEAMLCECIPIGSSVNIIPEIIGETGFVLAQKDINQLIEITAKALNISDKAELGKQSRLRVKRNFDLRIRRKLLLSTISDN